MAIEGTAVWAGSWTSPSTNTWSVRSMYSVVPNRVRPDTAGRTRDRVNTEGIGALRPRE